MYHYYLHGERGNLPGGSQSHREEAPRISLECIVGRNTLWQCDLADVKDDLESLYLQASHASAAVQINFEPHGRRLIILLGGCDCTVPAAETKAASDQPEVAMPSQYFHACGPLCDEAHSCWPPSDVIEAWLLSVSSPLLLH